MLPVFNTKPRSFDSAVCLSNKSICSRLLLPELFAPKKAVSGAIRTAPVSRHDLKLVMLISVNMAACLSEFRICIIVDRRLCCKRRPFVLHSRP